MVKEWLILYAAFVVLVGAYLYTEGADPARNERRDQAQLKIDQCWREHPRGSWDENTCVVMERAFEKEFHTEP